MSKSRKKKNDNSFLNVENHKNQTSLSKYFFPSTSNASSFRKRLPTSNTDDITPAKTLKSFHNTNEPPDKDHPGVGLSKRKDSDCHLEKSTRCSNILSSTTLRNKKLLSFSYNKRKSNLEVSKLPTFEKTTPSDFGNSSLEDLDGFNKNFLCEEIDQDEASVKKKIKYTPLENQYLEFQAKYPDAVLLIECGYKYRFFGKDAEIASKDLNIGCYMYHNFLSASIPTHRLHYHVKRLVLKGHKVGVIKQTESAALKAAGETKNELFTRELHALYSKSTFIEGELSLLEDENSIEVDFDDSDTVSGYLMCINEASSSKNQSDPVNAACVAVQVSSGDIFYSSYQDSLNQTELESYLLCVSPSEIILPSSQLSKRTENLIKSFSCDRSSRIERLDDKVFEHSFSLNTMSSFISNQKDTSVSSTCDTEDNLQIFLSLPSLVISCLSALKVYLSDFKVENILKNIKSMRPFSTTEHMTLNAATIRGLEILRNTSNTSSNGTLWWCMNQTSTKFGERLLKSWITKPLKDIQKIEERLNIVTEIIHSESIVFKKISKMLYNLPDLERILCSTFYHKCSCYEFLKLVKALTSIQNEFIGLTDRINAEIEVLKLRNILLNILRYLEGIEKFSSNIDSEAAKEGNKVKLFLDTTKYIPMETCKSKISSIEKKLNDLRPAICRILRLPAFKYSTVAGQKFLIEAPNSHLSLVPDDWLKFSVTKQVSRFRSPEVISLYKELEQEQERLSEYAVEAWEEFLNEFGEQFYKYKHAVSYLAELDCYLSLAKISKVENYCRPLIIDTCSRKFDVQQGFHPMVVKLVGEGNQFVANDIILNETERCLIVTGPNMGGKSTFIRQVALIALMAHIGCFVPAHNATIPLLDGIYVRLGADDDIVNKKSTFMSEMSEASSILFSATSNSLVILDELGRGTSTNDGAAIAYSTLEYLIREVKCFTLFTTHYPPVVELKQFYPENILTVHMDYILREMDDDDDIQTVTFLYNVVPGISEESYGINVAALAGISKDILIEAQRKSREMELKMTVQRRLRSILKNLEYQNSSKAEEL